MTTKLTKMSINNFKAMTSYPIIETYDKHATADNVQLKMTVHQTTNGRVFVIQSTFQVYGWTSNAFDAFQNWHNVNGYTAHELYNGLRKG